MYTTEMKRAVHSLDNWKPNNFGVTIIDNDQFLTLKIDPMLLTKMSLHDQQRAVEYVARLKRALEDKGAIVALTREPISQ